MSDNKTFITALLLLVFQPCTHIGCSEELMAPVIIVNKPMLDEERLQLHYVIRNETKHDLWIFEGVGKYDISAEVFMEEDNQTLLIRSRLDIPAPSGISAPLFDGRYVRLAPGRSLSESISLAIPVRPCYGLGKRAQKPGLRYGTRLAIEIGYYVGDLHEIIHSRLAEEKSSNGKKSAVSPGTPNRLVEWFGEFGVLTFNEMNEGLRSRDEEVIIPYTNHLLKGERPFRITIDGLRIPYEEKQENPSKCLDSPDLTSCTKVAIQYQPSILEYFFPYESQQSLLSLEEIRHLKSAREIVLEDNEDLKAIADDIANGTPTVGEIIRQRTVAHVVCYDGSERLMTFPIYNNLSSLIDNEECLFTRGEGFQSLKVVTSLIKRLDLRIRCAANLKDLWHRLRLYRQAEKVRLKEALGETEILYTSAAQWCDAMVPAYKSIGMLEENVMRAYRCPGAGEGKCHYAMNPNCKPDSPPDMVLLFETKAGWNQHGGPELFTFDNHDPKGGCVLLNNGTVKFVRTNEELQQLRWK